MNILLISEIEWCLFKRSFEKNLTIFNVDNQKETMKKAKLQYNQITKDIPAFGSNDALLTTLLNASILAAIYLSLPEKHDVELVKEYYKKSMNNAVMKLMLRKNKNFTKAYQRNLAKLATKSQKSNNSYAWKFKFIKGESLDSFDAIFEQCGICTLYKKMGCFDIVSALCAYDYDMAEQTNAVFTREYRIANGDDVCDCHYQKKLD